MTREYIRRSVRIDKSVLRVVMSRGTGHGWHERTYKVKINKEVNETTNDWIYSIEGLNTSRKKCSRGKWSKERKKKWIQERVCESRNSQYYKWTKYRGGNEKTMDSSPGKRTGKRSNKKMDERRKGVRGMSQTSLIPFKLFVVPSASVSL